MSNKFYNYRVRAVQPSAIGGGTGYLDFQNTGSYKQFDSVVSIVAGSEDRFTYRITSANEGSKYEYGVGYITDVSSTLRLTREKVYSSSQGNDDKVIWVANDGPLTLDMMVPHPNYISNTRINSNTAIDNIGATYFIDASGNLSLDLPGIDRDSVEINLIITSLSGSENERTDAVVLTPDGANTVNGTGTYSISRKNDLVTLVSDLDNNNWIVLDAESDAASSSGPNGSVQLSSGGVLGSDTGLYYVNNSLFIGGSGESTASIQLTASSGATFNLQNGSMDFAVNANGASNTLFVDGSTNRVGIRTNSPLDILHINTTGVGGIFISNTGVGGIPTATFKNSDPNFTDGTDIGKVEFIGVDSASNDTTYVRIVAEADDETDGSEEGRLDFYVNHNGTLQAISKLTYDDVQIGPNNTASGGVVLGSSNTNEGDNVVLGYSNNNCGTSSISVGHSNVISSGSYGGVFGKNHSVSGSHMWLFGGSGFAVTGNYSTYLVGDNNNYIKIDHNSQERVSAYVNTTGTDFNIVNTRVSTPGVEHKQNFVFYNSSGIAKTGLIYGIEVIDPAAGSEDTSFFVKILESGELNTVIDIGPTYVNVSNVTGLNSAILLGHDLSITGNGADTVVVGMANIIDNNVGNNTIVGHSNDLTTSGNSYNVTLGNSNIVDENYTTTVGTSNRNSGIYSAVVGYNNGIYGENISAVGVNNDVSGNNCSVIGYNNNLDNNGIYVIGQGNTSVYSGVHMIGNDITATGHNHTIIQNDVVIITGTTVRFDASVNLGGDDIASSGDNVSIFVNDAGYVTGDAYVTGVSYTTGVSSGTLVLSHHSGTVTGILNGVIHTGQNVSVLVNDANYLVSGTSNVSELVNDTGYITSSDFAVPKLNITFNYNVGGYYEVSGAGTTGEINPALYLHRGFSYDLNHVGSAGKLIITTGTASLSNYATYNEGITNNTGVLNDTISWTVRQDTPIVHDSGSGLWNIPSAANGVPITGRYCSQSNPQTQGGYIYIV